MRARIFGLAVVASVAVLAVCGGRASATTCSGQVNTQGTLTLPGFDIGTVASGCQIGPFNATQGQNVNPAVNLTLNPVLYQFEWGGGILSLQAELGNNGIGHIVNVELGQSGVTLDADKSLSSHLVSVSLPYSLGPIAPVFVFQNLNLAAGTYVLDTYLGPCAVITNCSGGSTEDPQFQMLFTPGPDGQTPLPAALPLFASGLGVLGLLGWRRKRKQAVREGFLLTENT